MSAEDIQERLIKLLFAIKKRQPLYLERRSVLNLADFIGGFLTAINAIKLGDCEILDEFHLFIVDKHPEFEYMNLFNILNEVSGRDEAKAFDLFFEEFESFLTGKGIEIPNFDKQNGRKI